MTKFYIATCITLLLYGWYFYFTNKSYTAKQYFNNLTNKRTSIERGIPMKDSAMFLTQEIYIDAPGELYQLKYKEIPSDSLLALTLVKGRHRESNKLMHNISNERLNIQLNPRMEAAYKPIFTELVNPSKSKSGYMYMILATKSLPKLIHLSPFTILDVNYPNEVNKVTIHLDEGAEIILKGLQIDTLMIKSNCNSHINLSECSIGYVLHQFDGGLIYCNQTIIETYCLNRTKHSYCTASAYVDVKNEIKGSVLTNGKTILDYEENPIINVKGNKNLTIKPRSLFWKNINKFKKY